MKKIYVFHSGSEILKKAASTSKYKDELILIDPTLRSGVLRGLRKAHLLFDAKSALYWVDMAVGINEIENRSDTVIIIFDSPIWMKTVSYIREKYSNARIVFWYWNIVKDKEILLTIIKNTNAVYSFDDSDAKKYNINHHAQFYWRSDLARKKAIYDVLFVGKNKGRLGALEKVYIDLTEKNLKPYFYVLKDKRSDKSEVINLRDESLDYTQVLELINLSKVILEINQEDQHGLTLRAMESLFLKKKLITNNERIQSCDFYNQENIRVFGENINVDAGFINKPFKNVDDELLDAYTFDSWVDVLSGGFSN